MQLFPSAFPLLATAHFLALISPGPDFVIISAYASRYRLRGSRYICLGIALGNGIYIALAMLGWHQVQQYSQLLVGLAWLGAGYLVWLGLRLLGAQPKAAAQFTTQVVEISCWRQLAMGLGSALLNPKNMLFYLSLTTIILGPSLSTLHLFSCAVWMFSAVLVWDLFIAGLFSSGSQRWLSDKVLLYIDKVAGLLLLLSGAALILRQLF